MDPTFQQAKAKRRIPKQPPSGVLTPFQQDLAKNPYALALSTPMRRCRLTDVNVPKYFLQDYKILSHPITGVPYFLPASLSRKHTKEKTEERPKMIEGITSYTLNYRKALSSMQNPTGGYFTSRSGSNKRAHHRLVPQGLRDVKPAMKMVMASRWRPDMEDFVLELMRRRCVEHLVDLASLKRGYLVGCADWEDAASKPSVAAFLWTGGIGDEPINPPTDFATLDLGMEGGLKGGEKKKRRKVPVYNLRNIIGEEKLIELRNVGSGIFGRDVVALKHKKMTVELQMQLWKLQGYMADYEKLLQTWDGGEDLGDEVFEEHLGNDDEKDEHEEDW
ncbi:uncharacterized protein LY89DRAFT_595519 [Mollisia scopiformis]|uniref:Uncharacterized protein n=1 Tax=Mollisia scopiformis TaxID=149040 RepID=A0A194WSP8_MOLSC|nr:uncharacterized protein LY89DRAFT_595519 [Mollisia scopiformis]KUJ10985.1 hypothetical protein LY89DRAFT_595519 [Mollisia scopiformis]